MTGHGQLGLFGDDLHSPGPCRDAEPVQRCVHGADARGPAACCEAEADRLVKAHHADHSYTERVLARLLARPGEWVDAFELMRIGGAMAWRSRCADARRIVRAAGRGGDIENKLVREPGKPTQSFYRFVESTVDTPDTA
jgi:hypothetical protein